jgi:hypothetical protein
MDPNTNDIDQQLTNLAGLADPLRRALYRHVTERGVPVSRDDAALADLLASAVAADPSGTAQAALHHAATLGTDLATQAATPPPPRATQPRSRPPSARSRPAAATNPPTTPTAPSACATAPSTASPPTTASWSAAPTTPSSKPSPTTSAATPHPRHPRPTTPTLLRRPDPRRLRVTSHVTISGWIPNSRLQARALQGVHRTAAGQVVGRSSLSACREP